MAHEPLKLSNQICFPLYASARKITKLYKPFLDPLGLTYTQYLALLVLWEEGSVTVSGLGERLDLDSGTVTPLLKRLEAQELVQRTRSTWDERVVAVGLTDKGRALEARALEIPGKMVACLDIPMSELRELRRLLDIILDK